MTELRELSDPDALVRSPRVSVVMLAYNHERFIAQAIESVLIQQSDPSYELVIGEDCSTDRTLAIVLDYQRRHPDKIRVLTSSRNVGMLANHARVIRASRAPYLALLEGDDFWNAADKLSAQAAFLDSHHDYSAVHSDYSLTARVLGRWRTIPAYRRTKRLGGAHGDLYGRMLTRNLMQTCTVMLRTTLAIEYLESGLPVESYAVGDWPLFLFLTKRGQVGYLDRPLATYRRTPGSVMNQGFSAEILRHESYLNMIRDYCDYFDTHGHEERLARISLIQGLAYYGLRDGNLARTRSALTTLEELAGRQTRRMRALGYLAQHPSAAHGYRQAYKFRSSVADLMDFLIARAFSASPRRSMSLLA